MQSVKINVPTSSGNFDTLLIADGNLTAMLGHAWNTMCAAYAMVADGALLRGVSVDHNTSGLNLRSTATATGPTRISLVILDFG